MFTVTVSKKYQVTIPKEIREKVGLRIGDKVLVRVEGRKIIIEPITSVEGDPVKKMLSLVKEPVNIDAVKLVEDSWDED